MSESRDKAPCAGMEMLLHALTDNELDAANALRCETHLRYCRRCAAAFADIRATGGMLRCEGVSYRAPERLRARILAAVEAAAPEGRTEASAAAPPAWLRRPPASAAAAAPRRWPWRRVGGLPALALAASFAALVFVITPPFPGPDGGTATDLRREVVAGHVRSLLIASHLTDVGSSSHHTVKPWFAGRLDFSPPVPELADAGFPLAGGRLDYLDGRTVAALVYRRRDHVINVFIWPDAAGGSVPTAPQRPKADPVHDGGHAVLHWTEGGMTFWAVSDLNAAELADFARLFSARSESPAPPS